MPHAIGTWPTRAHRPAVVTARRMARVFTRLPARRDRSFGRLGAVSEPRRIPDDPYANPPAVPKQFAKLLDTVKAEAPRGGDEARQGEGEEGGEDRRRGR